MFSKAKMGMLLGTMAAVLSLGSLGSALAADTATQEVRHPITADERIECICLVKQKWECFWERWQRF